MKFSILFFYTAYLLEFSVGYLLTTPMQSSLRTKMKNDEQVLKVVEMIELINGVYKDHGRNKAHSGRYGGLHPKRTYNLGVSRRFDLPNLVVNNLPASVIPKEIPEVLEEYSNEQKKKIKRGRFLMKKTSSGKIENQSLEDKSFNTDAKLTSYYNNAPLKAGLHNSTNITNISDTLIQSSHLTTNPNVQDDSVQEVTNIKPIYSPAFASDDSNEENDVILLKFNVKDYDKPRTYDKNYAVTNRIYKTNDFEKKTGIKARDMKHKFNAHEDNAHTEDLDDTGPNKLVSQTVHNDNDNNNDQVTEKEGNKKMRADNVNPKKNSVKNQGDIERKDTEPQHRSESKNKRKPTTPVCETSRKHIKKSNQDRKEKHLINGEQDRNEHSHRPHKKKKYEKIDNYEEEEKKDKKKNDKGNGEKEIDINNGDNQKYHDGHVYDRMEYEWNKRHLQYDKNYDDKNDKQISVDDVIDDDWDMRHDLSKEENNLMGRDKEKRERDSNERGSRITWDRELNMRDNIDSVIEQEDERYLSNERLNQSW